MNEPKTIWSYPADMEAEGQLNPQEWEVYRMTLAATHSCGSFAVSSSHGMAVAAVEEFRQFVKEGGA